MILGMTRSPRRALQRRFQGSIAIAFAAVAFATAPLAAQPMERPPIPEGDIKSWEPYFDRGVKIFRQTPIESERLFAWASHLDPTRAEALFARYAAFFAHTKEEEVRGYFRGTESLLRRPDIRAADSLRTLALMRNPFVHRGLEILIFDRLPGDFADDADTRAWIAYSNGEFPKAIELLTRTIDRGRPGSQWKRVDRVLAAVAMGDNRSALNDLRKLLELQRAADDRGTVTFYQSKHFVLYMIGTLLVRMRDLEGARTAFQESLVEDASFAYGNSGLAAVSRAQRNNVQAESEYSLAVELAPGDGVLRLWHAQVLFDLQRYADADAEVVKAIALEPLWPAPLHLLGRIRERQGREEEAYAAWAKYVAMAPAADAAARALKPRLDARPRSP
jgi:tetratricopeptide (TPR) repeat protein